MKIENGFENAPNSSERGGGGGLFKQKFAGTVKGGSQGKQRGGGKIPHIQQKKLISPHIIYVMIYATMISTIFIIYVSLSILSMFMFTP